MDPDAPLGAQASKQSTSDSVRNWVASFLSYLELRLRLLGLESKEAGLHLLVLALLFVGASRILCRLPGHVDGIFTLPFDTYFPLGMGLERACLWRGISPGSDRRRCDPSVSDR